MPVLDRTIAHTPIITEQLIERFLSGHNPQEGITSIECEYKDKVATIVSFDKEGHRTVTYDEFYPFVWCKLAAAKRMRANCAKKGIDIADLMRRYGIFCDQLALTNETGQHFERIDNGYTLLFYATRCMSFSDFLIFFRMTGVPVYGGKKKKDGEQPQEKDFIAISPVEQHMIRTGKRLFKGFENYDDIPRGHFDLETTGLDPHHGMISQIGYHTNRGYNKIFGVEGETDEEKFQSELDCIIGALQLMHDVELAVLAGHNSETFDWNFLDVRLFYHGTSLRALTQAIWGDGKPGIYKDEKEATLKLGGEVEHYRPTRMRHTSIVDSMHAVRRAMASDSDIENAGLKYISKFAKIAKKNRVYIKGDQIQRTWMIKEKKYAFCNETGDWYYVTDKKPLKEGYEMVSGRYIAERYLQDDLYETDKVELRFNESNFLINKFLPTTFTRACTMGTAGIWKLIIYAWYYENKLAIPKPGPKKRYVGGLSRLLCVGVVKNQAKLDYNSLYPSIMITWKVETPIDITHILLPLLNYVLTKREYYKGLKGKYGDMADELDGILAGFVGTQIELNELQAKQNEYKGLKVANDKKQLPFKTLGNSIYGSLGAVDFPLSDCEVAEKVTCIGRQCLRLMIHHFSNMGGGMNTPFSYKPIVGDTDGFNFKQPDIFRYTEENPYISTGVGRNTKEGKAYTGINADIAEFEDLFLRVKMGLGLDEIIEASGNLSRKNYFDLFPNGKMKFVGNTLKSKKMPGYIKKFINEGAMNLAKEQGAEFIEAYYRHLDDIYNFRTPLGEIAMKGKIKKTVDEYKAYCQERTANGNKKSRQAWYELVIANNLDVHIGDTIYYINTGKTKGDSDVKRITGYFQFRDGGKVDITKEFISTHKRYQTELKTRGEKPLSISKFVQDKELLKQYFGPGMIVDEDTVEINCVHIPTELIEGEEPLYCADHEEYEYNLPKYIEAFNKRAHALMVCFDRNVREKICVNCPSERGYFTKEECELVIGQPYKEGDQDTYEALMTMDRREVEFWLRCGEKPVYCDECGMDWEKMKADHAELVAKEQSEQFDLLDKQYEAALAKLSREDINDFYEDGKMPPGLNGLVILTLDDKDNMVFRFKDIPDMSPRSGGVVIEDLVYKTEAEIEKEGLT